MLGRLKTFLYGAGIVIGAIIMALPLAATVIKTKIKRFMGIEDQQ